MGDVRGDLPDLEQVEDWVAPACTLPSAEQPIRVAEFDDLFSSALRGTDRPAPTRLVLTLASAPGRADAVRELTRRESECCSFFTFALDDQDDEMLLLEVAVTPAHVAVLDAISARAARFGGLVA